MTATKLTTTTYCNHSTHLVQLHYIQNHHPVICQHRHLLLNLAVDGLKTSLAAGRRCSSSGIVPLFRLLPAGLVPLPGCCMPLGLAVQHGQHTLHVALCTPHGYTGVMEWLSGPCLGEHQHTHTLTCTLGTSACNCWTSSSGVLPTTLLLGGFGAGIVCFAFDCTAAVVLLYLSSLPADVETNAPNSRCPGVSF